MTPSLALSRRTRSVIAIVSAAVVAAGALLVQAPAASAGETESTVQTSTFGLSAALDAHGAARSALAHPANGATVRDKILVYNRIDKAITVRLGVVAAAHQGQSYLVGQTASDVSKRVTLKVDSITLQPHQQASIPVTIKTPRGGTDQQFAAITAASGTTGSGTVAVAQRLALFVDLTPTTKLVAAQRSITLYVLLGLLLLLLLILAYVVQRRLRRDRRPAARRHARHGRIATAG